MLRFLGLHKKTIKFRDEELAPSTLHHRHPPGLLKERRCKAPPLFGLRSPGKISRHGEPLCSRWEFSLKRRGREREKERERERIDTGGARFLRNWSTSLFSRKAFIL